MFLYLFLLFYFVYFSTLARPHSSHTRSRCRRIFWCPNSCLSTSGVCGCVLGETVLDDAVHRHVRWVTRGGHQTLSSHCSPIGRARGESGVVSTRNCINWSSTGRVSWRKIVSGTSLSCIWRWGLVSGGSSPVPVLLLTVRWLAQVTIRI